MPSARSILLPLLGAALALAMASRCPHCDATSAAEVLTSAAVWGRYRDLLTAAGRRERTIANYRRTLWAFWAELARHGKTWDRATPADLRRLLKQPVSQGRRRGRARSANYRNNLAVAVRLFYRVCYEQEWLATDRMRGVVVPKGGQPVARALAPAELRSALLAAEHDPRLWLWCWLGYGAGLRAFEIAALRVEDVHLAERGAWLKVADGKGGKQRTVPLYPEVRAALARWMGVAGCAGAGWLFESSRLAGRPVGYKTVSKLLAAHLHALGIAETAHGLRHSFTAGLLEGAGEEHALTIARMAGWEDLEMLMKVYGLGYKGRGPQVIACLPDPTKKLPNPQAGGQGAGP
jgi:integrase